MTDTQQKFLDKFNQSEPETFKSNVRDKVVRESTFEFEDTTYSVVLNKMFHWGAMQQLGQVKYFNNIQVFEHVEGDDECIPYQLGLSQDVLEEKDFISENLRRKFREHLKDMKLDNEDVQYAKDEFKRMSQKFNMTLTDRKEV